MNKLYKILMILAIIGLIGRFVLVGYILVKETGVLKVMGYIIILPLMTTMALACIHKITGKD